MRFFMDGRYIRTDFHDGISRFSHSLIHAVAQLTNPTIIIHDSAQRDLLPQNVDVVEFHAPTSVSEPMAALKLNAYQPDVVFSPMQTMGSAGRDFGLILTLHDLIYYQHRSPPRNLSQPVRGLWYLYHLTYAPQRLLLNGADAVATVSKTSQRLIRKHHLTSRPVHVISNAPPELDHARDPAGPREKTLIYMGSFMEYKNVETVISALQYLPEYQLHLCSRITEERRQEYLDFAHAHGVETGQLYFHDGIDDIGYRNLLREATALVTTSRSEGYGLPVAEAMAEGTPVVLSNLEIFQEIGGRTNPGAQFVDIESEHVSRQVADAVLALEDDKAFVRASIGAVRQAQTFRWDDSAKVLVDLAEDIHQRRTRRTS
ncbi:MAG: glycosyltransferase [Yaniella sp.]|uniref:glycosyltransferase n=1 Tax=Yaniella sp. TaxID=2773929 RepID=UPI0026495AAB|nr:glycosyltransferase [Yaniella sp.]MDN5730388.1 glycosyltransferase [Yaniella sp.]MDN5814383.1 glycosyltransferase [Yaniella sp.]MDN5816734.1 glycosyltransferase [Yaniella sp.]MDN5888232.1 glycosyltransferase [Yaniella sp.]MDN5911335.1 glycosyltransferase [Yaniella sp.]